MRLYQITNEKSLKNLKEKPFDLERDIQHLVENNIDKLFELQFIKSELTVGNYRIDTLCFDNENNSFVIIEYKKGKSYSVIDQGYTYLQLLLNNKSDFVLTLSHFKNKIFRVEDIDWSQSRIIFVSPSFNSYQRDSVNFKNIPFELYEIKRFENNTFILDKQETTSKESIDSFSASNSGSVINKVNKEVTVFDADAHISKLNDKMHQKWEELEEKLLELDDVELDPKKYYINAKVGNKSIAYLNFRQAGISIDINRGNLNPDGTTSKNFFSLDDPKNLAEEKSWEWKSGTKGQVYNIKFDKNTDLDYTMFLLKQKYRNIKETE